VKGSTKRGREIVLREIRASAAAWANVLDLSGATSGIVMLERTPWRAVLAILAGLLLVHLLEMPDPAIGVVLVAGAIMGAVEAIHRRDFITESHVVRQSGLLGGKRIAIPLDEIQRVEYSYPRFGEHFHSGTVDVIGDRRGITFVGVANPEELADFILQAKARVTGHGERTNRAIERAAQQ
jgi:hypothetical protein